MERIKKHHDSPAAAAYRSACHEWARMVEENPLAAYDSRLPEENQGEGLTSRTISRIIRETAEELRERYPSFWLFIYCQYKQPDGSDRHYRRKWLETVQAARMNRRAKRVSDA